jgi:branched-chain amino acid transport system substrate-binding protein
MACATVKSVRPVALTLLFVLVCGLLGVACGSREKVLFGAVLPLSGEASIYGTEIQKGIELAFEELQQRKGAPGMVLTVVDSESDPEVAKAELETLYSDGARAVIGGVTTPEAMAMAVEAEKSNRVLLSPSASTPELTDFSRNFYRVWPSDVREGSTMGSYAAKSLCSKAAILAAESAYAKGVQSVFQQTFEQDGGEVVELLEYPPHGTDLQPLVERVVGLKPECVYLADYAEAILHIIRLLDEGGYEGKILTVSAFASPKAISDAGELAEWVFITHPVYDTEDTENPLVQDFVKAYQEKYGETPGLFAAHGYDAMLVLYEAMQKGGDSGRNFWKGMRSVQEVQGVTGTLQFDEKGDVQKFPRVYFILEGRLRDHQAYLEAEATRLREEYIRLQREKRQLLTEGGSDADGASD